jgi:NADH-quinone oxidoreductase subunit M
MILLWLILLPLAGGLAAWAASRWSQSLARWLALAAPAATAVLMLAAWAPQLASAPLGRGGAWMTELHLPWAPSWGAGIDLAIDPLSWLLILLTNVLSIMAVAASWTGIRVRVGFFHFNLLWLIAAMTGIFLATDLLLFYVLWEVILIPLYFLIGLWGHEHRIRASIKFFIFTQASGLLMLVAILALYFIHGRATGVYTFAYGQLLGTPMTSVEAWWIMLGFFVAFAVKLPAVGVHSWLPDAHTQAPVAGSVDLAGLVLKVGAYGMLRFVTPLFPQQAMEFAPVAMAIGVAGILYGAMMAFSQSDLKRLVAYSSISHMGFVLLGAFASSELALLGVVVVMIAHGISTGALFILVGQIAERTGTRDMRLLGGLWSAMPRISGVMMLFALASLGLPGLGNFVGEFLVLLGAFGTSPVLAVLGAGGLVASVIYALWIVQRALHGPRKELVPLADMNAREGLVAGSLIAMIVALGLYPQPLLDAARPSVAALLEATAAPVAGPPAPAAPPASEGGP